MNCSRHVKFLLFQTNDSMVGLVLNRSNNVLVTRGVYVFQSLRLVLLLSTIVFADEQKDESVISTTRQPWLVVSKNIKGPITLSCYDPNFYPFQDLTSVQRIIWSLPTSENLQPESKKPGFEIRPNENFSLIIDQAKLDRESSVSGIYQCMAFANLQDNYTHSAWFLLRWAVDIFPMESMLLNDVPTVK